LALKDTPAWTHVFRVEFQTPGGGRPRRTALTGRPATSAWPVPPQAGRTLRRLPRVAMMEAADHRGLDDPAFVKALHRSWLRGVLLHGQVCSGPVVVDEVLAQQATQMGRLLRAYLAYYNTARPHQSLDHNSPQPREVHPPELGRVVSIPQVGGLHHRYQRAA
jgi:hypothetical protein